MSKAILKRKLLVIGCGRSGTSYTTKIFKEIGLDLAHERLGKFGTCSMYMVTPITDCSIVNKGQKEGIHHGECRSKIEFEHVWHQVRDPLKCIDSLAKSFTRKVRVWTGEQVGVTLPGRSDQLQCSSEDKLHWAMNYWYTNNLLCQSQAEWTYRLEDYPWSEMLTRLNLAEFPLPDISQTVNRGLRFAFKSKEQSEEIKRTIYNTSWETLSSVDKSLTAKIRKLARTYGYK
jgi:hypothetical protein